jgi:shikimate kinase
VSAGSDGVERILLIGMMGAGKTTIGGRLARDLGWDYLDSDAEVERHTGRTVPQLLVEEGEPAFRAAESEALARAVRGTAPVVISVAGGAVLDRANRDRIAAAGHVVWLRARAATLVARVGAGEGRPLLGDDPAAALERLLSVRTGLYEQLAQLTVDVDELPPDEVVRRVLAWTRQPEPGAGAGGEP